jgi:hypothetical protein
MTAAGRTRVVAHAGLTARFALPCALTACSLLLAFVPATLSAQTVEVAPFGGYRFGGDLFELATNQPLDLDGAPVFGGAVDIAMSDGFWFEAIYSHQQAHVDIPGDAFHPPARVRAVVDHWLAGGRQDFEAGRARPFLTGLLGLTRYGANGDNEVRFAIAAGGGVTFQLQRRLGVRFDGRVFTTFADLDARALACGGGTGTCLVGLNVNVVWQAEFSGGLVFTF